MRDASDRSVRPQYTPGPSDPAPDPFVWLLGLVTEGLANRLMAVLVVYAAIRTSFASASKSFWYDEVDTVIVARLPTVTTIWRALKQAIDGMPPLYYLVARLADHLVPNENIAFRIPSIAGLCCVLVCVFLFVRKRSGSVIALICVPIPFVTILYTTYAEEARPYSLVVAFVAIALLAYQHAPSTLWMLLMGFSLAIAVSLHYYAIFALVPFFAAEAALVLWAGRLRLRVWLALACGCLPLWVFWPLSSKLREYYGAHFWASVSLTDVLRTYGALFNTTAELGFTPVAVSGTLGVAAVMVLVLALLATIVAMLGRVREDLTASKLFSENTLVLGMLALPMFIVVAALVAHGGMAPRYALSTVLGLPLALGIVLPSLDRKAVALVMIFIFSGLVVQEAGFWRSWLGPLPGGVASATGVKNFIESVGYKDLPVVESDGFDYLKIQYYSSPEWKERFFVLTDAPNAVAYAGTDSIDKQLLIFQRFVPLHVSDFKVFASSHPRFLLYSTGGAPFDWWPVRLNREGYLLQLLNAEGAQKVYLVSAKGDQ